MLKIAVCDDEGYFRNRIENMISDYMRQRDYDCDIDCYESGKEMLETNMQKWNYDIAFLDVSMEEMDGIETAQSIRQLAPNTYIIFVTAYITYALDGYKVDAIRYLLKEDDNLELTMKECLDTVMEKMNYKEMKYIFEFQNGKMNLAVDRILYVESRLHKVYFSILDDGVAEYYMYDKLDAVEKILSRFGFYRIHQSFLVNMKYIKRIKRYKVTLLNGIELSISKKYYKNIEAEYIKLRGDI